VLDPQYMLIISAALFTMGVIGVLWRREAITILMSIELMLNGGNLAFITFSRISGAADGQVYVFFIMTLAAAEAAVGLAIVIALFRLKKTTSVDDINLLKW
jgi:NADH-quinone oxidoreductase subunit K